MEAYESFVRQAFAFAAGTPALASSLRRGDSRDPAGLADDALFRPEEMARAKTGVAYAMEIFLFAVRERAKGLSDEESARLGQFVPAVIAAPSLAEVSAQIVAFEDAIIGPYFFTNRGGWLTLKNRPEPPS